MSILIKIWAPDGHGLSENLVSKAVLTATSKDDQKALAVFIAAYHNFRNTDSENVVVQKLTKAKK